MMMNDKFWLIEQKSLITLYLNVPGIVDFLLNKNAIDL